MNNALGKKADVFFRWILLLFSAFLVYLFILAAFVRRNSVFPFETAVNTGFLIVISIVFCLIYTLVDGGKKLKPLMKKNINLTILLSLFILFILQITLAKAIYAPAGWDVNSIYENAQLPSGEVSTWYYSIYPNNLLFLFIARGVYALLSLFSAQIELAWVFTIINIIVIDLSIFLLYRLMLKISSRKKAVFSAYFAIFLYGLFPWIIIPYSDTLSMISPLIQFHLFLKILEVEKLANKLILSFIFGIFAFLSMQFKPTNLIIIIAIFIIYGLKLFLSRRDLIKKALVCSITFALAFLIANLSFWGFIAKQKVIAVDHEKSFSLSHYFFMGLRQKERSYGMYYGAYNWDDVKFSMSVEGYENRKDAEMEESLMRIKAMGAAGYAEFLFNKTAWVIGDGTFFWGGEGEFIAYDTPNSFFLAEPLQKIFYIGRDNYGLYAYIAEGIWLFTLLLSAANILKIKEKHDTNRLVLMCTVFGLLLFTILFEARARYLINHLPIFVALAAEGFFAAEAKLKKTMK